ncbi:hypothetical protein Ddye_016235 [Dipteronia dyeriana]|uniref:Transposase MuDR plant domain-containing protein n=1 Tax=Dipteronia dyeriana TaxID=168575 RepID=A0AAD9U6D6_9ROSI|nr:hypothetical protein Ddye_016235 [Dipteronia dyeriana]
MYQSKSDDEYFSESEDEKPEAKIARLMKGNHFKKMVGGHIEFEVGQTHDSVYSLRALLKEYDIQEGFNFKKTNNDNNRLIYECKDNGCSWRLHASNILNDVTMQVKTYNKNHECHRVYRSEKAKSKLIARLYGGVLLLVVALDANSGLYCARHIYANFRKTYSTKKLKDLFWEASKAYDRHVFKRVMVDIGVVSIGAKAWLEEIEPKHAFEQNIKCDHVNNNMTEAFNNLLGEYRVRTYLSLLEYIRRLVMTRFQQRKEDCTRWKNEFPPTVTKKIVKASLESRVLQMIHAGEGEYEMLGLTRAYTAKLRDATYPYETSEVTSSKSPLKSYMNLVKVSKNGFSSLRIFFRLLDFQVFTRALMDEDDENALKMAYILMMSLFDWEAHDYENGTDYYMSFVKAVHLEFEEEHNVGSDEVSDDRLTVHHNELDERAGSFHNYHTTSLIRSKTSLSDPNSKSHMFNERDFETPKIQIYSVSELANAKNIQDIDDQLLSFYRAEITNIRGETKVGEKPAKQSTFDKSGATKETVMDMDGSKENDDNVFAMETDGHHVETVFEKEMERNNVSYAVHLEKVEGCANEFSDNADGDTEIVHAKVGDTFDPTVLSKVHMQTKEDGFEEFGVGHPLSVDGYPSPAMNVVVPNPNISVVALDGPDPDVLCKDVDKVRAQKRSKYLQNPWTNPMPMRTKRKRDR